VSANHSRSTPPAVEEISIPPVTIIEQGLSTLDLIDSGKFPAGIDLPIPRVASIDVPTLRECSKQPNKAAIIDAE
jgi:hypothetical protein